MNAERRKQEETNTMKKEEAITSYENGQGNQNYIGSTVANVCVILGVLAFGFTVSYVLKAAGTQNR